MACGPISVKGENESFHWTPSPYYACKELGRGDGGPRRMAFGSNDVDKQEAKMSLGEHLSGRRSSVKTLGAFRDQRAGNLAIPYGPELVKSTPLHAHVSH